MIGNSKISELVARLEAHGHIQDVEMGIGLSWTCGWAWVRVNELVD